MDSSRHAYPAEAIEVWAARDGQPVFIRPIRPQDQPLIDAFVRDLSPLSRLRRFHAGVSELSPQLLDRFAHPDFASEMALMASAVEGGREVAIGEARYAQPEDEPPGTREFAVAVADAWHGLGIAAKLLRSLVRHAQAAGVERLIGDILLDNRPMLILAQSVGFRTGFVAGAPGVLRAEMRLRPVAPVPPPVPLALSSLHPA